MTLADVPHTSARPLNLASDLCLLFIKTGKRSRSRGFGPCARCRKWEDSSDDPQSEGQARLRQMRRNGPSGPHATRHTPHSTLSSIQQLNHSPPISQCVYTLPILRTCSHLTTRALKALPSLPATSRWPYNSSLLYASVLNGSHGTTSSPCH